MRITVITPVGPGHLSASDECAVSVKAAVKYYCESHCTVSQYLWNDARGELGRSRARNLAVAANPGADWYFFLDADDLCEPEAFMRFSLALNRDPDLVAVFGAIATDQVGIVPENVYPLYWPDLMKHGATGTLSMGCFVRGDVARAVPFNESMDAGEDFDFYLRILRWRSWTKLPDPLALIRRSVPSATGPRGYTSLDWRAACQTVIDRWKTDPIAR